MRRTILNLAMAVAFCGLALTGNAQSPTGNNPFARAEPASPVVGNWEASATETDGTTLTVTLHVQASGTYQVVIHKAQEKILDKAGPYSYAYGYLSLVFPNGNEYRMKVLPTGVDSFIGVDGMGGRFIVHRCK